MLAREAWRASIVHVAPGVAAHQSAVKVRVKAAFLTRIGRLDFHAVENLIPNVPLILNHGREVPPERPSQFLPAVAAWARTNPIGSVFI